jgi:cell division protein FtsW
VPSNKKRKFFKKVNLKRSAKTPDFLLAGLVLGLSVFGLIMVGNASVVDAFRAFGDKFYYVRLQFQWFVLGIAGFLVASLFDYRRLKYLALPAMIFTFVCLGLVLFPGIGTKIMGARRWLSIGSFNFQPAELAKLTFVLYLAAFLSSDRKRKILPFISVTIILALLIGLIMLEPDLGTTVVIAVTALSVDFASGTSIIFNLLIGLLGLVAGGGLIYFSPYRRERLFTFFDLTRDPQGASYHIRQILIAIGSGGLFGVGIGQSRQKYEYLPEVTTDSIFAIIAEEMGFFISLLVIVVYVLLIWRGFRIAKEAPDKFGSLLAVGIISWIGTQALLNLGAMVVLFPLTGVPLPFISYGGSSLVLALVATGILINISRQRVVKK